MGEWGKAAKEPEVFVDLKEGLSYALVIHKSKGERLKLDKRTGEVVEQQWIHAK